MGGAVSSGQNNDELIDNLKEAEYIKSPKVEQVFRIVDRAHYYLAECRDSAYKDLAWKSGTLHLSAPCIYSEVMEALELEKGMSFLNLGSGTGYLNTMVGLVIGPNGVNHGIELHADNVLYANQKLESFVQESKKFDDLELCPPQFVVGNCLNLAPENRLYDRVYCGASCPPELRETIQNLIKINGILVVPIGDQLLKIKRVAEKEFSSDNVLPVSFASLVVPSKNDAGVDPVLLPEVNPLSLQCICRAAIRDSIRATFDFSMPSVESGNETHIKPKRDHTPQFLRHESGRYPFNFLPTAQGLMIVGAFHPSDEDENEESGGEASDNDDFLDLQLRHHASALRRAQRRLKQNEHQQRTYEVDSDLSDADEGVSCDGAQAQDENGNKDVSVKDTSVDKNLPEAMESEERESSDDEMTGTVMDKQLSRQNGDKRQEKGKNRLRIKKSASNRNNMNGESSLGENNSGTKYENISDEIGTVLSPQSTDPTSTQREDSSVDEAQLSSNNSRSMAIEVSPSAASSSQLCIKNSYSTSADTSETSGFGSLGDDPHPSSSQISGLGSFRDDMDMSEVFMPSTSVSGNKSSPKSKSSLSESSVDGHTATDGDDSADPGWMDIEEDDEDSDDEEEEDNDDEEDVSDRKEKKVNFKSILLNGGSESAEDADDKNDSADHSPRGPDFTAFLKEKVNTLPIPAALKAFIMHYR